MHVIRKSVLIDRHLLNEVKGSKDLDWIGACLLLYFIQKPTIKYTLDIISLFWSFGEYFRTKKFPAVLGINASVRFVCRAENMSVSGALEDSSRANQTIASS